MKFFFKQTLKISAFYLEKQKSFIPKKKFWSRCQYQNKKALFTDPIFSEGFGLSNKGTRRKLNSFAALVHAAKTEIAI